MEKYKLHFKTFIKHILSKPTHILFLLLIVIFFGIISAENTIPIAPSDLTYGTIVSNNIPLTWTDNATNEDKFNVERKLSTATTWATLTQISVSNTTSYTDTTATAGSTYDYRVQACLSGTGCSDYTILSGVVIPTTTSGGGGTTTTTIPMSPSGLTYGTIVSNMVPLVWTDNSNNEDKFNIERKLSTATSWSYLSQVGTNNLHYIDNTVTVGMIYDYRVQACLSGTGCSAYTTLTGISVPLTVNDNTTMSSTIPLAPSELSLVGTTTATISLKWVDNANNEDKFNIDRKLSTATGWFNLTQIAAPNISSFVDGTIVPGVSYDYRVQACLSGTGCSAYTVLTGVSAKIIPTITTIPIAPSNLSYSYITPSSVSLKWADNSNNEDKFNIERKLSTATGWATLTQITAPNISSFIDRTITPGVFYDYRVQACLSGTGCSPYTYLYKVVTLPSTPIATPVPMAPAVSPITQENPTNTTTPLSPVTTAGNESKGIIAQAPEITKKDIVEMINKISNPTTKESKTVTPLDEATINLIYQDTNKDGISDYDSVHVYNMDPKKPSPISTYEGKEISASEKVLLGFDPTKTELVKVEKEQPIESKAVTTNSYKVEEIKLTGPKEIVLKGQALPNSFITLYIYSTPIMVTIKTDNNGEWQYVLDKELENGKHTVYTATVNNTGNIVAQSPGFVFTKTAEAVTLNDLPGVQTKSSPNPGFLESINIYLAIAIILAISITVLVIAGALSKKNEQN